MQRFGRRDATKYLLRRGVAQRRGEAMRAAGNPCTHEGEDGHICKVCNAVLAVWTPYDDFWFPLLPCDWADLNDHERRFDFHWGKDSAIWWGQLPLPEKPKIA